MTPCSKLTLPGQKMSTHLALKSYKYALFYFPLDNTLETARTRLWRVDQNEAIISLIEKKDKDKRDLSNLRLISLINVDVKIGLNASATRLENVLPNIIHFNQSAYVKGRTFLMQSEP